MERLTSSKYLINMERPMAVEAFAGGRRLGAAATAWGNHWWVSGGIFGRQVDIIQKEKNRGGDGYGFTGAGGFFAAGRQGLDAPYRRLRYLASARR